MIWFLIQKVGFFIFLFLTIKFVLNKKHESLLILYFFGLVFSAFFYFAITIWDPAKIVTVGMLISMVSFSKSYSKPSRFLINGVIFFMVLIIISDIIALLLPGELAVLINPFQRLIIQNYAYFSALMLLFYGSILKKDFVKRIIPKYYLAIELAILIGLIHFFCLKVGIEFMPLMRTKGFTDSSAIVAEFGGEIISRIYGFSGEPKNYGFLVSPYVVMMTFSYLQGVIRKNRKYHLAFLILGFFVVFQTYSSSVLLTVILSILFIVGFYRIKINPKLIGLFIIVFGVWLSLSLMNIGTERNESKISFLSAINNRTFGRASNELQNDRQETVIWNTFSKDKLIHHIFGYGIAQYTFHVPNQSNQNTIIPVQSGLVLTLVDLGFLGLFFYLGYGIVMTKLLILSKRSKDVFSASLFILAIVSYIGSFMYGNITTSFIYFMLAIYNFQFDKNKKANKTYNL
jgi:hypothetical protein